MKDYLCFFYMANFYLQEENSLSIVLPTHLRSLDLQSLDRRLRCFLWASYCCMHCLKSFFLSPILSSVWFIFHLSAREDILK